MPCQLDQVRNILDIAAAVKNALAMEFPGTPSLRGLGRKASSVVYGLLLLQDYDVFMQEGVIQTGDKTHRHYWVDVYMDGEPFVLDTTLTQFEDDLGEELPEIVFMPGEEAGEMYGYAQGKDIHWQPGDCPPEVWQRTLGTLKIDRPLAEILLAIEKS